MDCRTRVNRGLKDRTGQDSTWHDRARQDSTGKDRTGQDRTKRDWTGQGRVGKGNDASNIQNIYAKVLYFHLNFVACIFPPIFRSTWRYSFASWR